MNKCCKDMENTIHEQSQHIRTLRKAVKKAISVLEIWYSATPNERIYMILHEALKATEECEGDEE